MVETCSQISRIKWDIMDETPLKWSQSQSIQSRNIIQPSFNPEVGLNPQPQFDMTQVGVGID